MDTLTQVKEIIAISLPGIKEEDMALTTTFAELNPDSLEIVDIIMKTEDAFEITITEERAEKLVTVGDLVSLIETEQQKVGQPAS